MSETAPRKFIHLVGGARPNFVKIAPLYHALRREPWCRTMLVHTGQHYAYNMSAAFFQDLDLPEPDVNLEVGSGSHAQQTAAVMVGYEKLLLEDPPDLVIVAGDVNSTLACTLAAKKLNLAVAHLEAGLRSFDRTMPEEINRLVTDCLCDLLWTPSQDADVNLRGEGVDPSRIRQVGNIMMDSLEMLRERIEALQEWRKLGLAPQGYGLITLHRPSNVDAAGPLGEIVRGLIAISRRLPLVFPVHPRTRIRLAEFGLREQLDQAPNVILTEPMAYLPFMSLLFKSRLAITDSGGLQEETTYLGIPCLTLRPNTERPITITEGTNRLVKHQELTACLEEILGGKWPGGVKPPLWDGHTADRIVASLKHEVFAAMNSLSSRPTGREQRQEDK